MPQGREGGPKSNIGTVEWLMECLWIFWLRHHRRFRKKTCPLCSEALRLQTLQPRWKARWSWQWQGLEIGPVAESKPSVFVAGMRLSCTVKLLLGCCWLRASVASLFFCSLILGISLIFAISLLHHSPAHATWTCRARVVRRPSSCWVHFLPMHRDSCEIEKETTTSLLTPLDVSTLRFIIYRFHSR